MRDPCRKERRVRRGFAIVGAGRASRRPGRQRWVLGGFARRRAPPAAHVLAPRDTPRFPRGTWWSVAGQRTVSPGERAIGDGTGRAAGAAMMQRMSIVIAGALVA